MTISFFLALHRVYTIFYFAFCVYYGGKLKKQLGFDDWLSLIGLEEVVKEHGGGKRAPDQGWLILIKEVFLLALVRGEDLFVLKSLAQKEKTNTPRHKILTQKFFFNKQEALTLKIQERHHKIWITK